MKENIRTIGGIEYILIRKRVKNLNLRITSKGKVSVSAPYFVALHEIDNFIIKKRDWIQNAVKRHALQENEAPCTYTKEQALLVFNEISDKIFPLFSDILYNKRPIIKARLMKTRWGVCNIQKRIITLNVRLLQKPYEAIEYVVLHEYAHFVYANHKADFHALLLRLMPDYKMRRELL